MEASSTSDKEGATANSSGGSDGGGSYDCNICLELAQDPVVTLCGHLFCWPCLYRWLVCRSSCKECPVCKSAVEEAKVIPIYGRGKGSTDPRTKGVEIPHRPAGRRTDIPQRQNGGANQTPFQQMGFSFFTSPAQFGNVTLSAGFGLVPFLFGFSTSGFPDFNFNFGNGGAAAGSGAANGPAAAAAASATGSGNSGQQPQQQEISNQNQEALLSRLLLFLGFFVIVCLFFF